MTMLHASLLVALCCVSCNKPPPAPVPVPATVVIVRPVPRSLGHIVAHLPADPRLSALIDAYNAASDAGLTFAMRAETTAEQIGLLRELDHAARTAVERCQVRGSKKSDIASATDAIKRLALFVHEAPH